jgi:hypothetical protein
MGLGKFLKDAVRILSPVGSTVTDLIQGKTLEESAKETAKAHVGIAKAPLDKAAEVKAEIKRSIQKAAEKIGGESARNLLEDIDLFTSLVDGQTASSVLGGLNNFIDTGELSHLSPLNALVAGELKRTRERYWDIAQQIPPGVLSAMPKEIQPHLAKSRCILVSSASGLALPSWALKHLGKADAIVIIDLIFFNVIPGHDNTEDLHLWAHEAFHLKQYRDLGVEGFTERFLGEEQGGHAAGSLGNALEIEADIFACRNFPVQNPRYLPGPCSDHI